MALVRELRKIDMERYGVHGDATCTYSVFRDENGDSYLQIDTYGSNSRRIKGKKSQSTQFGPEALQQLKEILKDF